MGTIISFINLKGGVGKTTITFNVAGVLALEGKKVLAIDMDPQSNLSILSLGEKRYQEEIRNLERSERLRRSVYQIYRDAIFNEKLFSFENAIIRAPLRKKNTPVLLTYDLLPSIIELGALDTEIAPYPRSRYRILHRALKSIRNEYDYILIDCPPSLNTATNNALYASDFYTIPTIPDFLSMTGIPELINKLNSTIEIKEEEEPQAQTKLAGIIVSLYRKKLTAHREGTRFLNLLLSELKEKKIVKNSHAKVFETWITDKVDVKRANEDKLPVCEHNPRSSSTAEFRSLTHEILDVIASSVSASTSSSFSSVTTFTSSSSSSPSSFLSSPSF